jgi:hypothetical protein
MNVSILKNSDLYKNQYSMDMLKDNLNNLNEKIILITQHLDAEFCVKYILDLDIDNGSEDSYIFDKTYILNRQKHITVKEFDDAFNKYYLKH